MKNYALITILLLRIFCSCTSNTSFKEYSNTPIKFAKKKIESSKLGYTIVVPHYWRLIDESNLNVFIETYTDGRIQSPDFPFLSIAKFKWDTNDLDLFIEQLNEEKLPEGLERIELDKTDFLKYKSYYSHVKTIGGGKNKVEVITLMLKAKEDSTFYTIMCSVPKNENYKTNMAKLLYCTKQFTLK